MDAKHVRFTAAWLFAAAWLGMASTSGAETADHLDCVKVRDGADLVATLQLTTRESGEGASCTIVEGAVMACRSVQVEPPTEGAAGDEEHEDMAVSPRYDRVCYEVECEPDASRSERIVRDRFGTHVIRVGRTAMVCEPALILAEDLVVGDGESHAGPASGSARAPRDSVFTPLQCGDANMDGSVTATDALATLRAAVGIAPCLPCVCDADGSTAVSATDALVFLKFVVGQQVTLKCQPDGSPVFWDAGGDGVSWSDGANWDIDRVPNGCEDVTVNAGTTVVHDKGNNQAMRVTSSSALDMDGGSLAVRDTIRVAATFRFIGGTLSGATVLAPTQTAIRSAAYGAGGAEVVGSLLAPVVFTSSGGTLDGVTMQDDMDMSAGSAFTRIENGLVLNATCQFGSSAQLIFQGGGENVLSGTAAEVRLSPTNDASTVNVTGGTTLRIDSDVLIHAGGGTVGSSSGTAGLINQGTIDSDVSGRTVTVRSGAGWTNQGLIRGSNGGDVRLFDPWTNTGQITIVGGGELTLDGTWQNQGTITSVDSTVNLDGNFDLAAIGTFDRTGGTVNLTGTFDNTAGLLLDATTGSWVVRGGTIVGGEVDATDGSELVFSSGGGTLDGVTMQANMNMSAGSAFTRIENDLVLNSTCQFGSSAQLIFQGGGENLLTGTAAEVRLSPTNDASTVNVAGGTTLRIDSDVLIHAGGGQVGSASSTAGLINQGTIDSDAAGRTVTVRGGAGWTNQGLIRGSNGGDVRLFDPWTNTGQITIVGGGTLTLNGTWQNQGTVTSVDSTVNLDGTFTLAALGTFDRTGGTVNLTGTFDNATNLLLDATTGSWVLRGGTIVGGEVDATDGSELIFSSGGGTLDGVTMQADMNMSAGSAFTRIENDLVLNATCQFGSSAQLIFQGGGENLLTGTAAEVRLSPTNDASTVNVAGGTTLRIDSDVLIHAGGGQVGSASSTAGLINQGTIDSDVASRTITLRGGAGWTNSGTLRASTGNVRTLDSWTNGGSIQIGAGRTFTAQSGFTQSAAGSVTVDIASAASFGVLDVTGAATLNGTLTINRTGGFEPNLGDTFVVMSFDSRGGDFTAINGLAIGNGKQFSATFDATSLTLEVVPQ